MTKPRTSIDRKRRTRRMIWAGLAASLAVATTLAIVFGAERPIVEVARVRRGTFERYVEEDGRTRVRDRYVVASPLAGRLERLSLHVGDSVSAGDVVASVHPLLSPMLDARARSALEQQLGAAEARLSAARATLARAGASRLQAEKDLARTRTLATAGALAAHALETAQAALTIETHSRDAASQAVHVAEHDLDQARAALEGDGSKTSAVFQLRAPVNGRVLQILQESETVVAPGAAVMEIGDPNALEVVVDVLSTDAVSVEPGMRAEIAGWGGREVLRGLVRTVQPVASVRVSALGVEEERADVIVDPIVSAGSWKRVGHGYRVDVRIPVERIEGAVIVPTSALFREGETWRAFVAADGVTRSRHVGVSSYGPRASVVRTGLREGDQVVLQPPEWLRDGSRVQTRVASD